MEPEYDLLTVGEISARLKVKPSWVYAHTKDLGAYHLGKYLRFSWERVLQSLDRYAFRLVSQPNDLLRAPINKGSKMHREQFGNRFPKENS
jgi:hypothetical protein